MVRFDPDRREALARLAALGALGLMAAPGESRSDPTPVDGKARIVIVGAGAAGLASASHLRRRLPQASITLIDARRDHYYQPGFTLVGAGIKPVSYVVSTTQEYVAAGVEWVQEAAAEIDPEARRVTTAGELAQRFGVSLRTIYRDLGTLEQAGIPLCAEPGKGYSLAACTTARRRPRPPGKSCPPSPRKVGSSCSAARTPT